jgi:AtzE family amidohydrolase
MVPLTLGSDTNGSIRVPAALCGIYGLKPTYGRLGRGGARLFAASFDHMGPLARSVADLAVAYDALQGSDPSDPAAVARPPEPVAGRLDEGIGGLRIALAKGYFTRLGEPEVFEALEDVAGALGVTRTVELPQVETARAAAMLITAAEGAELHLADLRTRNAEFDPKTRYLFLAGAMLPAAWYVRAQRFRRWYCEQLLQLFRDVDVILAPATPYPAFPIGTATMTLGGQTFPAAAHLGVYTQPISFAGLPVIAAPVAARQPLPIGVQIIAAPWREDLVFRVAKAGEALGILAPPPLPAI